MIRITPHYENPVKFGDSSTIEVLMREEDGTDYWQDFIYAGPRGMVYIREQLHHHGRVPSRCTTFTAVVDGHRYTMHVRRIKMLCTALQYRAARFLREIQQAGSAKQFAKNKNLKYAD